MTTATQQPPTKAPQQSDVKKQVATSVAPPSSAPSPKTGKRRKLRAWLVVMMLIVLAAGGGFAWTKHKGIDLRATITAEWHKLMGSDVPEGFAFTNGRVEATKVYITTKYQGRIQDVLAREGDTVEVGQVLARMDTRTLQAQLRQAEAQIQRARDAKNTATATVRQREADVAFWQASVARNERLINAGGTSREEYEAVYAKWKADSAALAAAKSQVIEAQAAIDAAIADADRLRVDIEDGVLVAPRRGRVQYRLAEPGEVLAPGGRVLDTIDLTDVYMLFYLPEAEAGKVTVGAEARLLFDAIPGAVIPATVYFVAPEAQFTPKTVETRTERQKLAFQVRARIDAELLKKYEPFVKIGLPGEVYVRLDPAAQWPERLKVHIPEFGGSQP
jgi:HlyD family secretion protein